ncbi:hypothetical protein ACXR2T_10585 [Leucobacter sp. HY1910]
MGDLKYVAQRNGTWELLHRDLPLKLTSWPEWGVNFYGVIEGHLAPGFVNVAADGHPIVDEWGTIISAETGTGGSRRRWQGIVDEVTPDTGGRLKVRVRELHGAVDGLTFTGNFRGVQVDPVEGIRAVWQHTQAKKSGDLGVTVVGATSRRVGTDSDAKLDAAKTARDAAKAALDLRSKPRQAKETEIRKARAKYEPALAALTKSRNQATDAYDALVKAKAPKPQIDAAKATVTARQAALKAKRDERDAAVKPLNDQLAALREAEEPWKEAYDDANTTFQEAQTRAREDGGALKIEAADSPDGWKSVVELAKEYGFEITSRCMTTDGRPDFRIMVHDPEAGRVRDDLVFQQGVNVISELKPRSVPYASEVLGRGAGEGDGAVRSNAARVDRRFPRNRVLSRPGIKSSELLRVEVGRELALSGGAIEFPSITVRDHKLAALWSWAAGDTILVQGRVAGSADPVALWHRIVSWRLLSDIDAELRLERVYQA